MIICQQRLSVIVLVHLFKIVMSFMSYDYKTYYLIWDSFILFQYLRVHLFTHSLQMEEILLPFGYVQWTKATWLIELAAFLIHCEVANTSPARLSYYSLYRGKIAYILPSLPHIEAGAFRGLGQSFSEGHHVVTLCVYFIASL